MNKKSIIIISILVIIIIILSAVIIITNTNKTQKISNDTTENIETSEPTATPTNEPKGDDTESVFEKYADLDYSSNLKDDINGKVALIKLGEKTFQTEMKDGYYIYVDNFNNSYKIKQIIEIESEFVKTATDNFAALFKAVVTYEDNISQEKSFEVAVIVYNPEVITESKDGYIGVPYLNYTSSTSFVRSFTDLYQESDEISEEYAQTLVNELYGEEDPDTGFAITSNALCKVKDDEGKLYYLMRVAWLVEDHTSTIDGVAIEVNGKSWKKIDIFDNYKEGDTIRTVYEEGTF